MGAWGVLAFDNDTANDWAYKLEKSNDLLVIENTLRELEKLGHDYVDSEFACDALAACEVIARLRGNFGYQNADTEKVDWWVRQNPIRISDSLRTRAAAAIDRILGEKSELRDLFEDSAHYQKWLAAIADLKQRATA